LAEIIANEYNLNIPRYVDTYETEERIDIDKVAGELVELDKQMAETDEVIADCCKELGISTTFKL
jgi:type I restriction enzyme M protein